VETFGVCLFSRDELGNVLPLISEASISNENTHLHFNSLAWLGGNCLVKDFEELIDVFVDQRRVLELGGLEMWADT